MILRDIIPYLDKPAVSGSLDTDITGFAYDSRLVGPGIAFVAIRGTHSDGHDFIGKAIELGAAAIFAEQAPADDCTVPWVHVRHSRTALAQAAATLNGFPAKGLTIAGITGTNGKTTTAFLLHHLFNSAQMRSGLLGTVFYDLGDGEHIPASHTTPESLEIQGLLAGMRGNGCRACVMEVSSHALDQDRIHGLPFAAAIFTNLTQDHLDYHGTMEKYFEAKVKLFQITADSSKRSALIINGDDSWGRKLAQRFEHTGRVVRFGFGVGCEYRAINVRYDMSGTTFELEAKGRSFLVRKAIRTLQAELDPAEFLRVHSPSAEVQGHGQPILQFGKQNVALLKLEPAGNYALKLTFDDGHDSGLFTWDYLYQLANRQEQLWREYEQALHDAGRTRDPAASVVRLML